LNKDLQNSGIGVEDPENQFPDLPDYNFDLLETDLKEWPIYKLNKKREFFINEINQITVETLESRSDDEVQSLIAKTIYQEKNRMRKKPWKVDPPNERLFWNRIEKKLTHIKGLPPEPAREQSRELLLRIINRYSEEIVGNFKTGTFKFARTALTMAFKILFNKFFDPYPFWGSRKHLLDKIRVTGSVPHVRKLMEKGTVILAPTHSSNLDSIFIGYAIDYKAGLPSFCYGAGLNLFNSEFAAYFMNRMGTYRLDRRKKNPIYLETLKNMSQKMTMMGVNNLFFPGGTRSRSGKIEERLKLGLLGTLVEAQRALIQRGNGKKIYVVPVILSYPFVLEARVLIDEYLRAEGKEKYFKQRYKKTKRFSKLTFFNHLFTKGPKTWVSYGQPMDVLGNPVNEEGESLDKNGGIIDIADYFKVGEAIRPNPQRESVYTKVLAESILRSYREDNVVLPVHFTAYVAFKQLEGMNYDKDLFEMLRLEESDIRIFMEDLLPNARSIHSAFNNLAKKGKLKVTAAFHTSTRELLETGLREMGNFSARKPLKFQRRKGYYTSEDVKLLYFYHNRLVCYESSIKEEVAKTLENHPD